MQNLGLIIAVFGGVFLFISVIALALDKNKDRETSAFQWLDILLIGGIISFFLGLAKGISDIFHDRNSSTFIMTMLFFLSIATLSLGVWMM